MRKQIVDSRLLHYALLVMSLSVATVGGLVLLGCFSNQVQDVTVVDPEQRDAEGGVKFSRTANRTEASVNLAATLEGQPVTWHRGIPDDNVSLIPDPTKSNEVLIRMPESVGYHHVMFTGSYTVNGRAKEVITYVPVRTVN